MDKAKDGKEDTTSPRDHNPHEVMMAKHSIPATVPVDHSKNKTMKAISSLQSQLELLLGAGKLDLAEAMGETISAVLREKFPMSHSDILRNEMNLAGILHMQSKFDRAETLQGRTITEMKARLGESHQFTVQCTMNQAETFASTGRTKEAVSLLENTQHTLPTDHEQLTVVKSSLATKLVAVDRLADAKTLYLEVMNVRRKSLGPKHSDTLCTTANLAGVYVLMCEWKLAEQTAESVLPAMKKALGVEHPHVMACLRHLALALQYQSQYERAETLFLQLMERHNQIHGKEHIETFNCMSDVASLYKDMGRYKEAEKIQESAANSLEKTVGEDHTDTLYSRVELVSVYIRQGRYEDAVNLGKPLAEQTERVLGKQHTTTLGCLQSLALAYVYQDRLQEAERLEREVLQGTAMLDRNHPVVLTARASLALTCFQLGKYDEAKKMFANDGVNAYEDPAALTRLHDLSFVLSKGGCHDEAIAFAEHVLQVRIKKFANDKPRIIVAKSNLAMAHYRNGNLEKAQRLLEESIATSRESLGTKHPTTLINVFDLALVLFQRGEIDLAEDGCASIVEDLEHKLGSNHDTYVRCKNLLSRIRQVRKKSEIRCIRI